MVYGNLGLGDMNGTAWAGWGPPQCCTTWSGGGIGTRPGPLAERAPCETVTVTACSLAAQAAAAQLCEGVSCHRKKCIKPARV